MEYKGLKWFWSGVGAAVILVLCTLTFKGCTDYNAADIARRNNCEARGGNIVYVDKNYVCATVEYKVTQR